MSTYQKKKKKKMLDECLLIKNEKRKKKKDECPLGDNTKSVPQKKKKRIIQNHIRAYSFSLPSHHHSTEKPFYQAYQL